MIDARFPLLRSLATARLRLRRSVVETITTTLFVPVAVCAIGSSVGCGGGEKSLSNGVTAPQGARSETLEHETCDTTGKVEGLDTNNDGKPDILRVFDGNHHEKCRTIDLNHDGRPDLYEYFDSAGALRRREFCYDNTGSINAIEFYESGKLLRREYDTTGQHRIDTWDWFDPNAAPDPSTGRPPHPVRRERDTRGNGAVDQWWTWDGSKISIANDRDGDGHPDPGSVFVLGGSDDAGAAVSLSSEAGPSAVETRSGGTDGTSAEGGVVNRGVLASPASSPDAGGLSRRAASSSTGARP
jgi:hypothetical protein